MDIPLVSLFTCYKYGSNDTFLHLNLQIRISRCVRSLQRCTLALLTDASHSASRPSLEAASPLALPSSTTPWTSPRSSSPNTGKCFNRYWFVLKLDHSSLNEEICPAVLSIGVATRWRWSWNQTAQFTDLSCLVLSFKFAVLNLLLEWKHHLKLICRLLRQGVIEAKTRGSRKQRKEKKNRTKKVELLIICHLVYNSKFHQLKMHHYWFVQVRGTAKAKVGQAGKKVRSPVMLTLLLLCELGLTISSPVRCLALLETSTCPLADFCLPGFTFPSINGRILNVYCYFTVATMLVSTIERVPRRGWKMKHFSDSSLFVI